MKIIGTGSALPKLVVTNEMMTEHFDTTDEWIRTRTGIETRHLCSKETLIDLGIEACKKAIENAGVDPKEIDYFICSNVANNYVTPAMSCVVQGAIGAQCPRFDINCACTGFIFALDIAESFIQNGRAKKVLILCAEEPSKFCDWKGHDRTTSILFGDGAGAIVVSEGDDLQAIHTATTSIPDVLWYKHAMEPTPFEDGIEEHVPLQMDGKGVFRTAVTSCCKDVDVVLNKSGVKPDDVDLYVLHQANFRIIDAIRNFVGQPAEKFPTNLQHYGNTSSASIPILLDELHREGKLRPGMQLVFSAFGAGFVSGAAVMKWSMEK